jgi:hypothetical protein
MKEMIKLKEELKNRISRRAFNAGTLAAVAAGKLRNLN